ncbi:hypothetical protein GCM10009119_24910 [Algoriphagus jejuensis]|uniref:Acetyltransferase (GNAT) family protein n=1 Tax=Algoriphagus jejuensis TaxID=419934 RepID=A0ABN1N131_9BACT
MEAYRKETEVHELRVFSSIGESHPYFLRNSPIVGIDRQLDFAWVKKGKLKASITFSISDNADAVSLPQSPFGGIFVEMNLSSASLEEFVKAVLVELKRRQIITVRIVQPPKPYEPGSDLINYILFKNGFEQEAVLSHQFFIGKKKIKKFVKKEQLKFQTKAKESGVKVQVGSIQNFGFLQEIRTWNREKGYESSFDEKRLIAQVSDYPERYFLITVSKDGNAIGHTLAVKLFPDSLYYFLSAVHPKSPLKSVGELCLLQLFQLAAEQNTNFIDLGSSDTDAGANHSLMFFKSRFSNEISNKISWILTR